MHRILLSLFAFILCNAAFSQDDDLPAVKYPALPSHASTTESFVPKGWTIEKQLQGDLNADAIPDLVLVLRCQDRHNIIKQPGDDHEFDSNPRILAVLFADKNGGYTLAAQNHGIIPRPDSYYRADPFEGIDVVKGTIQLRLISWASVGTWWESATKLTFRYREDASVSLVMTTKKDIEPAASSPTSALTT